MFWELLRESVLVQGFVTVCFVVAFIVLACLGRPIPDLFSNVLLMVIGYWFGTYTQKAAQSTIKLFKDTQSKEEGE